MCSFLFLLITHLPHMTDQLWRSHQLRQTPYKYLVGNVNFVNINNS